MSASSNCDHKVLVRSLDDRLSEEQEADLAEHLSSCTTCREELVRLAGSSETWTTIQQTLDSAADDPVDQCLSPSTSRPPQVSMEASWADTDTDFAVDFLEPSDKSNTIGRIDDIDIVEVIGRGGMGIVLKGLERETQRPVAVKVLAPHLAANGAARQRFAREAQAAAVVVHPNVTPILAVQSTGRLPHLVMPFTDGESLQERIDSSGPFELVEIVRIALQIARGLSAAHAVGLVHRDIKPANILLERGLERAMLTDFGLAQAADDASLTGTGLIAGTPHYMAPEQATGERPEVRSDLFSLGSVIYAMCTGRPPFRAETTFGVLRRLTDASPRPIVDLNETIPLWLQAVVFKLLQKDPNHRYESAAALADQLEECLAHVQRPSAVPLPKDVAKMVAVSGPSRGMWHGLALTSLIVCGLIAIQKIGSNTSDEKPPPQTAPQVLDQTWADTIDDSLDEVEREIDQLESNDSLWNELPAFPDEFSE